MVCLLFPVDWVEMVTLQGPQRENFQKKAKGEKKRKKGCMSDAQFLVISFDRTKLFCFVGYMCDWLKCDVGERVRVCVPVVIKVRWGVMLLDTKWRCKRFDLLSSRKIYCFLTGLVRWPIVNKLLANPRCIHTYTQTKTGVLFEVKKKIFLNVLLSSRWRSQW